MSVSGPGGGAVSWWDAISTAGAGATAPDAPAAVRASGGAPFDPAVQPTLTLGRGNDTDAVKRMQSALNVWRGQRGMEPLAVDGGFGPATKAALAEMQRAGGLGADGVCGPRTWQALAAAATRPAPGPRAKETFPAAAQAGRTDASTRALAAAWRDVPGATSVVKLPANGGRAVAIHVPPGFDPGKPARVETFFHGHGWDVGGELDRRGVLARLATLQAQDPQTIFVMPQSGPPPFSGWMKPPESFKALHEQALGQAALLAGAPAITVGERTVSAHSGSGYTLQNAIRSGELVADKVNLLDASYNDWSQSVARWALSNQDAWKPRVESWYTRHASQAANNAAIARMAPGVVTTHDVTAGEQHNDVPGKHFGTR